MDPHKILGIDKSASPEEIRRAYVRQAAKYHPDKGGDAWVFQQIQEAYEQLTGESPPPDEGPDQQATEEQRTTPGSQESETSETPFPDAARQGTRSARQSRRRQKGPASQIIGIVAGGVAGIVIAACILWYGFGLDPLGVFGSRTTTIAGPAKRAAERKSARKKKESPPAAAPAKSSPDASKESGVSPSEPPLEPPETPPDGKLDEPAPIQLPAAGSDEGETDEPPPAAPGKGGPKPEAHSDPPEPEQPASEPADDSRQPLPSPAEQQAALAKVEAIFQEQLANATAPVNKIALARMIAAEAKKVREDSAGHLALLRKAFELATDASNLPLSQEIAQELWSAYELDELTLAASMLERVAKNASSDTLRQVSRAAVILADRLADAKRFALAAAQAKLAEDAAVKVRDAQLRTDAQLATTTVKMLARREEEVQIARGTLAANPGDPDASDVVGRYLCLENGEWDRGLRLLAQSSNADLKLLAKQDLLATKDATAMIALGDAWRELSKSSGFEGFAVRAAFWYERALPAAKGLDKIKVEKALADLPGGTLARRIDLLDAIEPTQDAVVGKWRRSDGAITHTAPPPSLDSAEKRCRLQAPYQPPGEYNVYLTIAADVLKGHVNISLPVGGKQALAVLMCGRPDSRLIVSSEVQVPARRREPPFSAKRPSEIVCKVRSNSIQVFANGTLLIDYQGNTQLVENHPHWTTPDSRAIGLGAFESSFRVTRFDVQPITSGGKMLRGESEDAMPDNVWDVLAATDEIEANMPLAQEVERENKLLLAKVGRWYDALSPTEKLKYAAALQHLAIGIAALTTDDRTTIRDTFREMTPSSRAIRDMFLATDIGQLKVRHRGKWSRLDELWTYGYSVALGLD